MLAILNPSWCGLFGQLRRRGGIKVSHFRIMVSGGLNFHSSYTNSTSYESWHFQLNFETLVRSLRLIVWPQEVTEVTEVKMKKKYAKIVKSPIFDSQKCNIPQKKPHENRHSDLKWNYRVLEWKSWKKMILWFSTPKNHNFLSVSAKFLKNLSR